MIIRTLIISFLASVLLTSCLKDKHIEDREYGLDGIEDINLVEFPDAPNKAFAINYKDFDTTFTLVTVRLNAEQTAQQDVKVTLGLDDALITKYNTANGTHFTPAPASLYTLDNLTVTIPKGSQEGLLKITTNPADLSAGEYALGLSIKSIDGAGAIASANYDDVVVYLGVKNNFDGEYTLNVSHTGWAAFGIVEGVPRDYGHIALVTKSGNSVIFENHETHTDLQPGFSKNAAGDTVITQFGAASPIFTFDLVTNKLVNVDNAYPDDGRGRDFFLNPAAPPTDNVYDPVTRTIIANYYMTQTNPSRANLIFRMVMEYEGPR